MHQFDGHGCCVVALASEAAVEPQALRASAGIGCDTQGVSGVLHDLRRGDLLVAAAGGASTRRYDVARQHISIARADTGCRCQRFQRHAEMPQDQGLRSSHAIDVAPELTGVLDLLDRGIRKSLPQEALAHMARSVPLLLASALEGQPGDDGLLDWLRTHADADTDRGRVAAAFGWHPDHLTRVCRTRHGCGFSQLLNRFRCERSLDLLQGDDDLETVAHRCGFASAGYFIRVFRRHYGCTPGVWRGSDLPPA
ncbi:MAG: helix-turn-helix transcriptional regulator [Planctomycetota bacterium]